MPIILAMAACTLAWSVVPERSGANPPRSLGSGLAPTVHQELPASAQEAWLVPGPEVAPTAAERTLATAINRLNDGNASGALALLTDVRLAGSPLAPWAAYQLGAAYLAMGRPADAVKALEPVASGGWVGVTAELASRGLADAAESAGDLPRSLAVLTALAERPAAAPDEVLKRLAEVASRAGEGGRARAAWLRLYYDYPLSSHASLAEPVAAEARAVAGPALGEVLARDAARGDRLFDAKRYVDARAVFERLMPQATGDLRELVDLRVAECDYFGKQYRAAIRRLEPWLETASRRAEARHFYLQSLRALGRTDEFVNQARALVRDFPESTWTEDTLNSLATHFILTNEDAEAAATFEEIVRRFPNGRTAERAAWKAGWWQYKTGEFAKAAETFDNASMRAPRSDYRPAWLYWAGRARAALGETAVARDRFDVVIADYRYSYYGRLALDQVKAQGAVRTRAETGPADVVRPRDVQDGDAAPLAASALSAASDALPNADVVARLLALELWSEAIAEIQFAQRNWGTSPRLEATLAWIHNRQGDLRRGITVMRRAYPQFMAEKGDQLPRPVLEVIFPVSYWELIRKYSAAHGLDPHVVTALIAQESTFQADVRSSANAWGLMQLLPSTGRRLARQERMRRFNTGMLKNAETNVRLGTRYFASLIDRFGGVHFALASYNAGESRVVRWRAERPGLAQDEFIDDIPFPETQNYVKRILGTAEDYRALYPIKSAKR